MLERITKRVSLSQLKAATYNPVGRIHDRRMRELIKSMRAHGLLYPILVSPDNSIIDGHRRAASAKKLGWSTIKAIVVDDISKEEIYASVNGTASKMTGNDVLGVFLKEPAAISPVARRRIETAEASIGRPMLNRLYKAGLSMKAYSVCVQIARMCDRETTDNIVMLLEWLLDFKMFGRAMKAIAAGESPEIIMDAAKKRKPIKMKLSLAS